MQPDLTHRDIGFFKRTECLNFRVKVWKREIYTAFHLARQKIVNGVQCHAKCDVRAVSAEAKPSSIGRLHRTAPPRGYGICAVARSSEAGAVYGIFGAPIRHVCVVVVSQREQQHGLTSGTMRRIMVFSED